MLDPTLTYTQRQGTGPLPPGKRRQRLQVLIAVKREIERNYILELFFFLFSAVPVAYLMVTRSANYTTGFYLLQKADERNWGMSRATHSVKLSMKSPSGVGSFKSLRNIAYASNDKSIGSTTRLDGQITCPDTYIVSYIEYRQDVMTAAAGPVCHTSVAERIMSIATGAGAHTQRRARFSSQHNNRIPKKKNTMRKRHMF